MNDLSNIFDKFVQQRLSDHYVNPSDTIVYTHAEKATAATADPAVIWARGASSRQVGQDRWRQGRSGDGARDAGTRLVLQW